MYSHEDGDDKVDAELEQTDSNTVASDLDDDMDAEEDTSDHSLAESYEEENDDIDDILQSNVTIQLTMKPRIEGPSGMNIGTVIKYSCW